MIAYSVQGTVKVDYYKELIAYQKAYKLVLDIDRLTEAFPKEEMYGLTSQIRRAATSIPSNIAEGFMRGPREYAQFLKVALGSTAELETRLSLAKDIGFVRAGQFEITQQSVKEVLKLLTFYNK